MQVPKCIFHRLRKIGGEIFFPFYYNVHRRMHLVMILEMYSLYNAGKLIFQI